MGLIIALVILLLAIFSPRLLPAALICGVLGAGLLARTSPRAMTGGVELSSEQQAIVNKTVATHLADPASYEDPVALTQEFSEYEENLGAIAGTPAFTAEFHNELVGGVGYDMSDEAILATIRSHLERWRQEGVLLTAEEFSRLDPSLYHKQLSKHILPKDTFADVTRIFGAEYLRGLALRDGVADLLKVPSYRLVVQDLRHIRALLTSVSEPYNGREEGLVWRAVEGVLYADKVTGAPATAEVLRMIGKATPISPYTKSWARAVDYPKGVFIQTLLNSTYSDYGPGVGAHALGDNFMKVGEAYVVIDTELKSFNFRFNSSGLKTYLAERFKALHDLPVFDRIPQLAYEVSLG